MANKVRKIGKEDIQFHDSGTGSAVQTYKRVSRLGGADIDMTAISAADLPLLDAPLVTAHPTPMRGLSAKNVEVALADYRKYRGQLRNIEHWGMVAGTGVSAAVAAQNVTIWNLVVADAIAYGGGILVPNGRFEGIEAGGTQWVFNVPHSANIPVIGMGPGSILAKHSTALASYPLFRSLDGYGHTLADFAFDAGVGSASSCAEFIVGAYPIGGFVIDRVGFTYGTDGLKFTASAAYLGNLLWANKCQFVSNLGLRMTNFMAAHITQNNFLNAAGIICAGTGGAALFGESEILSNLILGTGGISVQRSGTYNGDIHKNWTVNGNKVSNGVVRVEGVTDATILSNMLYAGGIQYVVPTTAQNLLIKDNHIAIGINGGAGIEVFGTDAALIGFEIAGGRIYDTEYGGLAISMADMGGGTAFARGGRVHDIFFQNNSNHATGYAVTLPLTRVTHTHVKDNLFVTTTGATYRPSYCGREYLGSAWNRFEGNRYVGFATNPVLPVLLYAGSNSDILASDQIISASSGW